MLYSWATGCFSFLFYVFVNLLLWLWLPTRVVVITNLQGAAE